MPISTDTKTIDTVRYYSNGGGLITFTDGTKTRLGDVEGNPVRGDKYRYDPVKCVYNKAERRKSSEVVKDPQAYKGYKIKTSERNAIERFAQSLGMTDVQLYRFAMREAGVDI